MGFNNVKKRVIFIRADGGLGIGLGHIMRMLVLAKQLVKDNDLFFLCKDGAEYRSGIDKITSEDFKVIKIEKDNCTECIISLQEKFKADVLITDSYDVNDEYFDVTRKYFNVTGYVDDLNMHRMNVDFVINQNINAEKLKYAACKNTALFLGTRFCMIREEFKKAYKLKQLKNKIEDMMVTVGGMDNLGLSVDVVRLLADYDFRIDVVIGAAFSSNVNERLKQISMNQNNIILYENAMMSKLMLKCDAAVSACGSTLYELCAMNVPSIGIIVADNQEQTAFNMKKAGAVFGIVHKNELDKIKQLIDILIKDTKLKREIIDKQKNIVNIYGSELLADNINKIIESRCL